MQSQQTNLPTTTKVHRAAADEAGNYQTGRGCLMLSLMLLGAIAISVVAIILFRTPTT